MISSWRAYDVTTCRQEQTEARSWQLVRKRRSSATCRACRKARRREGRECRSHTLVRSAPPDSESILSENIRRYSIQVMQLVKKIITRDIFLTDFSKKSDAHFKNRLWRHRRNIMTELLRDASSLIIALRPHTDIKRWKRCEMKEEDWERKMLYSLMVVSHWQIAREREDLQKENSFKQKYNVFVLSHLAVKKTRRKSKRFLLKHVQNFLVFHMHTLIHRTYTNM